MWPASAGGVSTVVPMTCPVPFRSTPFRRRPLASPSSLAAAVALTMGLGACAGGSGEDDSPDASSDGPTAEHLAADEVQALFADSTVAFGLDAVGPVEQCLAPADLDGDGLEDLLLWRDGRPLVFRRAEDGRFVEADVTVTGADGDPPVLRTMTCAAADLDRDGRKDIVAAGLGAGVAVLWATGTFEYHQTVLPLDGDSLEGDPAYILDEGVEPYTAGIVLLDIDLDQLLDIHVIRSSVGSLATRLVPDSVPIGMGGVSGCCSQLGVGDWFCCGWWCADDFATTGPMPGPRHHLFRQTTERGFDDVSLGSGANPNVSAWAGALVDANEDGLPDVFLANDFAPNEALLARGDGTFDPVPFERVGGALYNHAMGVSIADFNADGHFDAALTEIGFPLFLVGDGSGGFDEVVPVVGHDALPGIPLAWGLTFADLDLDADPDLYMSAQYLGPNLDCWATSASGITNGIADNVRDEVLEIQANLVHLNAGGVFDVTTHAPPVGEYRGTMVVTPVDLDGDFDDDLLALEYRTGARDRVHLRAWENTFEGNNRVRIRLESALGDAAVLGARIEVVAGNTRQLLVAAGPDGHAAHRSRQLNIGLGGAARASVRVARPGQDFGAVHSIEAGAEVGLDDLD